MSLVIADNRLRARRVSPVRPGRAQPPPLHHELVKDSNAPANRTIFVAVGAPVGARNARKPSRLTRMRVSERGWSADYRA